ncbi:MAG: glycosyltransferase [Planctomycetota bacterium]|nr:glycosyltransferase [Planctomycetota bacterium]
MKNFRHRKICFVAHQLNFGGMERFISRLVNHLDKDFFQFRIVCIDSGERALEWIEDKSSVEFIELQKRLSSQKTVRHSLASYLETKQIDIVQSHNFGTLADTCLSLPRNRKMGFIHAERGTVLGNPPAKGLRLLIRSLSMRYHTSFCDQLICNAHEIARKINAYTWYPLDKIRVIPNGIPLLYRDDEIERIRCQKRLELGISSDDFVLGMVGRLVDVKNYPMAIKAFCSMRGNARQRFRLLIIGDGPLRSELQSIAEEATKPDSHSIHFAGEISNCVGIYPAFDVFLNTSRSEGMSQALLEALSCGRPVLATDVGDHKRILEGTELVCGAIVQRDDWQSLAKHLSDYSKSPELLVRLGGNALELQRKHYSLDSMIAQYDQLYRSLLKKLDGA